MGCRRNLTGHYCLVKAADIKQKATSGHLVLSCGDITVDMDGNKKAFSRHTDQKHASGQLFFLLPHQGLPDGIFAYQKSQLLCIIKSLQWKILVGIFYGHLELLRPFRAFYGHLVYFVVIWYVWFYGHLELLRPFRAFYGHLVYFGVIWYVFFQFGRLCR
jgi:hypothetical protein